MDEMDFEEEHADDEDNVEPEEMEDEDSKASKVTMPFISMEYLII